MCGGLSDSTQTVRRWRQARRGFVSSGSDGGQGRWKVLVEVRDVVYSFMMTLSGNWFTPCCCRCWKCCWAAVLTGSCCPCCCCSRCAAICWSSSCGALSMGNSCRGLSGSSMVESRCSACHWCLRCPSGCLLLSLAECCRLATGPSCWFHYCWRWHCLVRLMSCPGPCLGYCGLFGLGLRGLHVSDDY